MGKMNISLLSPIDIRFVIGKSGQTLKNGKLTISVVYTQHGFKPIIKSTKLSTFKHSFKNQTVLNTDPNYKYINLQLNQLKTNCYQILNDYVKEFDCNPTINQFLSYMENYIPKFVNFNDLCQSFNNTAYRTKATSNNYLTLVNSLYEFDKKLLPCDFTIDKLEKYIKWMEKKKLKHNTIMSRIKLLKALLNFAVTKKILSDNPIKEYKIQPMQPKKGHIPYKDIVLMKNNLNNIEKKLSKSHAHITRAFLFSCGTGLRFSDIRSLEMEHIENGWVHKIMIKTKQPVHTPLFLFNNLAQDILDFYNGDCTKFKKHLLSNVTVNKKLKEVFDLCGINHIEQHFTFHTACHTFATLLMEDRGDGKSLTKEQVSLLLGHTTIKETKGYIDMSKDMFKSQILGILK